MDRASQPICLASMAHLSEAKCAEDDWAGISDWPTRKQRQNRLNQRAYRRRKALKTQAQGPGHDLRRGGTSNLEYRQQPGHDGHTNYASASHMRPHQLDYDYSCQFSNRINYSPQHNEIQNVSYRVREQRPGTLAVQVASKTIEFDLYEPYPILSDHLLSLVKYNLYRAVAANSWSLGIDPRLMHSDILSPFTSDHSATSPLCFSLPSSLHPTALQRSIPHHPYIDLFPFPSLRDRLMQIANTIDEDELCADFAGENLDPEGGGHTGLTVWGEPWDPHSWEIAEPLWKKWSWLLGGCSELFEATNHWRQKRDEPRLVEVL